MVSSSVRQILYWRSSNSREGDHSPSACNNTKEYLFFGISYLSTNLPVWDEKVYENGGTEKNGQVEKKGFKPYWGVAGT